MDGEKEKVNARAGSGGQESLQADFKTLSIIVWPQEESMRDMGRQHIAGRGQKASDYKSGHYKLSNSI